MKILFICTHNRCRSILAEAVTNHVVRDDSARDDSARRQIQAVSAGSSPQGQVHPSTLHYMSERGISIDGLYSKSWDHFEGFNPNAVITLCDSAAQETCPVWFGDSVQAHWGLADPSKLSSGDEQKEAFNMTIDILERRVRRLLDMMNQTSCALTGEKLRATLEQIALQID